MKVCSRCNEAKPLSEFGVNLSKRDDYQYHCRACDRDYQQNWRSAKSGTTDLVERDRRASLRYRYGLSLETYEDMMDEQLGRCAICLQLETAKVKRTAEAVRPLAVDHDAETGSVRGLLCSKCNTGLGLFRHDKTLLSNAIEYLWVTK